MAIRARDERLDDGSQKPEGENDLTMIEIDTEATQQSPMVDIFPKL